ncbi:MAG: hypothetical protein OXF79_12885 [Chloroflexi bacterium]|nr:hypothetical protein [Chloroflexota bacterium]
MEIASTIVAMMIDLFETWAWPITALALGFMFRPFIKKAIEELLPRLARLSYGNASADFITRELTQATAEPVPIDAETRREIQDSPLGTVVQSWQRFLWESAEILREYGTPVRDRSPMRVIPALLHTELIDQGTYGLIERLRVLRNQAVHEPDHVPTPEGADLYFRTTEGIIRTMRNKLRVRADSDFG